MHDDGIKNVSKDQLIKRWYSGNVNSELLIAMVNMFFVSCATAWLSATPTAVVSDAWFQLREENSIFKIVYRINEKKEFKVSLDYLFC